MLTTAKPPLYRICDDGKANVTASVEFFVAYWRTITGAMVNRSCLKYNTMAKCEKELPGSEKILDTYFSVPYVPEEEFSFMTKMILVLDRMVDRHPESVSTSK